MISAAPDWSDGERVEADLCIVGAGLVGLTLAQAFLDTDIKVLVLEAGGPRPTMHGQDDLWAESDGMPNHSFAVSRFRAYGGPGDRWAGLCPALEPRDLDGTSSRPAWPVTPSELAPWLRRAETLLDVSAPGNDVAARECRAGSVPTIGSDLRPVMLPFARRRNIGEALRERFRASGNVRVVLGADVLAIETDAAARRVESLRIAFSGQRRVRCRARNVVLAAGGVENARLLLLSNDRHPCGLGNPHGHVGRWFMDHVYCNAGHLEPAAPEAALGPHVVRSFADLGETGAIVAYALTDDILTREGLNGAAAFFIRRQAIQLLPDYDGPGGRALTYLAELVSRQRLPDRDAGRHAAALLRHAPEVARLCARRGAGMIRRETHLALRMQIEATPHPDSRVSLAPTRDRLGRPRAHVTWTVSDTDMRGADRLWTAIARGYADRGLGRLVGVPPCNDGRWPASATGGKHHMGTTRMSADPRLGVVDADGRVHGMENLHIVGSSVFPTGGWANPTLTALALALRLASRLKTGGRQAPD